MIRRERNFARNLAKWAKGLFGLCVVKKGQGNFANQFTAESALKCLQNPRRKHPAYILLDFIPATQLEKEITVEDLKAYTEGN